MLLRCLLVFLLGGLFLVTMDEQSARRTDALVGTSSVHPDRTGHQPRNEAPLLSGVVLVEPKSSTNARRPVSNVLVYLGVCSELPQRRPLPDYVLPLVNGKLQSRHICVEIHQEIVYRRVAGADHLFLLHSRHRPQIALAPGATAQHLGSLNEPELAAMLVCAIQPEIQCFVTVVPNHHFAWTREDGSFTLPNHVPAGTYQLHAFKPNVGVSSISVTLPFRHEAHRPTIIVGAR